MRVYAFQLLPRPSQRAIDTNLRSFVDPIMQFFSSFSELGYTAIVLILTFLFVGAGLFNMLKMHRRGLVLKLVFALVLVGLFAGTTIYLADQRAQLMEAIKDEGGLKRTFPEK